MEKGRSRSQSEMMPPVSPSGTAVTLFSIATAVRDRKPLFVVQVAAQDKAIELTFDLMTAV
jgi:hypothetical protein